MTDDSCPLFVMISIPYSSSSIIGLNNTVFFIYLSHTILGMTILGIWSVGLEGVCTFTVRRDFSANGKIVNNLNMTLLSYSSLKQNITNELRFILFDYLHDVERYIAVKLQYHDILPSVNFIARSLNFILKKMSIVTSTAPSLL